MWLSGDYKPNLQWSKVTWGQWNVLKSTFINWSGVSGIIKTKDRFNNWRVIDDDACRLCEKRLRAGTISSSIVNIACSGLRGRMAD